MDTSDSSSANEAAATAAKSDRTSDDVSIVPATKPINPSTVVEKTAQSPQSATTSRLTSAFQWLGGLLARVPCRKQVIADRLHAEDAASGVRVTEKRPESDSLVEREKYYREREENTWAADEHASRLNLAWLLRARSAESDVKRENAELVATRLVYLGVLVAFVAVGVCVCSWWSIVHLVESLSDAMLDRKTVVNHAVVPTGFWQITVSLTASVLLLLAVSIQLFRASREYRVQAGKHSSEIEALRRVEAGLRLVMAAESVENAGAKKALMKFGQTLIDQSAEHLPWKVAADAESDVSKDGIGAIRDVTQTVKRVVTNDEK